MHTTNNKVLVTGATEGIGYAITKKFTSLGNTVIAVGRKDEKLKSMAKDDPRIIPFRCDMSKMEELEALAFFIEQQHKDINILVNNAGIQYNYQFPYELHLLNKINHEVNVNLLAPLRLIALLLPTMIMNPGAAIINVSSGLGLVPKRSAPVYCGTKAGIHIFTKALRYQLSSVKVFEIIPPLVDTEMTRGRGKNKISPEQLADEFMEGFRKDIYEIRIGKVKVLYHLNRFFPRIAERILKNS